MPVDISSFYNVVLGYEPYPYQARLACSLWPDMLDVPTGLGKTAAIYLAWQYKRASGDGATPRRLVWCLPMRVLVEQTAELVRQWTVRLKEAGLIQEAPSVHVLMGGHIEQDWDSVPDRDMVVIGTQDQLLSRALNRGYSMGRFRWPMDFALLNSDCLWVFDEVQLMGPALGTSAQLEAFRHRFGTAFPCRSLWCSATLRPEWLRTVDFAPRLSSLITASLQEDDLAYARVRQRTHSRKALVPLAPKSLVKAVVEHHSPGTLTLVIRNTVKEAVATYKEVVKKAKGVPAVLLHSRFRPQERKEILSRALAVPGEKGLILVTTQVVEAGVDISASALFTDLAPWSSLVQRFGRCNRAGELDNASIFWLNEVPSEKKALPYTVEELTASFEILKELQDGGPAFLPRPDSRAEEYPIPRARDILELFDTTPDLAGADIDISRFIRDGNEADVQVFWRDWEGDRPPADTKDAVREELCTVPLGEIAGWLKDRRELWFWDHLEEDWRRVRRAVPGAVYLIHANSGGYDCAYGWDASSRKRVEPVACSAKSEPQSMSGDPASKAEWQTLEDHARRTREELERLFTTVGLGTFAEARDDMKEAAFLHDWGKAHEVFQLACADAESSRLWAKAPRMTSYARKGFRHELASALALLASGHSDLTAYLAAAHHGKIRLSLRAMPGEDVPEGRRFARGIWEGDALPETLGKDSVELSLACMELGDSEFGASWTERAAGLLEKWGPFRLAMMEALIRTADWRASAHPQGGDHA